MPLDQPFPLIENLTLIGHYSLLFLSVCWAAIPSETRCISHLIPEPAVEVVRPELSEPGVPAVDPPGGRGVLVVAVAQAEGGAKVQEVLVET